MKKFLLLLKKELREMLVPQLWIPFFAVMVVFFIIGNIATKQSEEQAKTKTDIAINNLDHSQLSDQAIQIISQFANISEFSIDEESNFITQMQDHKINIGLTIPKNFETNITISGKSQIQTYAIMNNFSVLAGKNLGVLDASKNAINEMVSNIIIDQKTQSTSANELKNPVSSTSFISANHKIVEGNPTLLLGYMMSQTTTIPVVLFVVIVMAAQMIAASVATEKENKTLETLLSLPISRKAIVVSKMLAAGLVSLVMAGIYMLGIRSFNNGITSNMAGDTSQVSDNVVQVAQELGLKLTTTGILEIGAILFLAILLALTIAMILGAFSEDAKSAQGLVAPLMILVMIPYFLTLFLDINTLSPIIKYLIYAIPFSHVFLAMPNILLGNHTVILWGSIYMLTLFILFVLIAAKIFSSDLILTMKLNFSKKKK